MLKRTPFTPTEVARYQAAVPTLPEIHTAWAPGTKPEPGLVSQLASAPTDAGARKVAAGYSLDISPVTDNRPFFWHFAPYNDVIRNIAHPLGPSSPKDEVGERVLLLLLAIAVLYAFLFLLAPFVFVRREWRGLPRKGLSAVYFAAVGLAFMFYEITMIQRLVRFLGYPTYSLTVTLATLLVSTGVGALVSRRFAGRARTAMPIILAVLAVLTLFYEFVLPSILDGALLSTGLPVRIGFVVVVLAPLGVCLGMFMPIGLDRVASLTEHGEEYVAWAWAVNGFFAVIGSVLTTILSMALGFRVVQFTALAIYMIAVAAFTRLPTPREVDLVTVEPEPQVQPVTV
jgi:hypothetical protein